MIIITLQTFLYKRCSPCRENFEEELKNTVRTTRTGNTMRVYCISWGAFFSVISQVLCTLVQRIQNFRVEFVRRYLQQTFLGVCLQVQYKYN